MIEGSQAILQKLVYMLGNVVCLGLAVYKCQVMGLLPTTTSDWLAFVEPAKVRTLEILYLIVHFQLFLFVNVLAKFNGMVFCLLEV